MGANVDHEPQAWLVSLGRLASRTRLGLVGLLLKDLKFEATGYWVICSVKRAKLQ